jgi:hypothetical protein
MCHRSRSEPGSGRNRLYHLGWICDRPCGTCHGCHHSGLFAGWIGGDLPGTNDHLLTLDARRGNPSGRGLETSEVLGTSEVCTQTPAPRILRGTQQGATRFDSVWFNKQAKPLSIEWVCTLPALIYNITRCSCDFQVTGKRWIKRTKPPFAK